MIELTKFNAKIRSWQMLQDNMYYVDTTKYIGVKLETILNQRSETDIER